MLVELFFSYLSPEQMDERLHSAFYPLRLNDSENPRSEPKSKTDPDFLSEERQKHSLLLRLTYWHRPKKKHRGVVSCVAGQSQDTHHLIPEQ